MTTATDANQTRQTLSWTFILLLGVYFALHILLRVQISDSLDYDEAEQALLAQWLLPGYTEQPPLYSWLQYAFFRFFDNKVLAVSLLKNGLLFLTYLFVFLSGKKILRDPRAAILATCSLLLIPQIAWESQRDMTHTTLVVSAAAATFWQVLRLVEKQELANYLLFGLLLAIGILGKANFVLFIAGLLLALVTFSEGRRVVFSRKILASLLVVFVICGSYFFWMFSNQDIVFSATHKFNRATANYQLKGLTSLFSNSFLFLTPMWLVCLLVFPAGFRRNQGATTGFHHRLLTRYLLIIFLFLLAAVLIFKVSYIKDRWLQPLLFVVPVYFFSRLAPAYISAKRFKTFLGVISVAAVAVYLAFTIRVAGASYTHRFCRMNYPFTAFARDLRQTGFNGGLIISNNRFIAGNMRLKFPGSTALIPGYSFETRTDTRNFAAAAVLWKADHSPVMPPELASFLTAVYHIEPGDYPISYIEHLYKYNRKETVKLGVMQFPLSATSIKDTPL